MFVGPGSSTVLYTTDHFEFSACCGVQRAHPAHLPAPPLTSGVDPEESLDALCGYRDKGGRLLYLGGNGFYWRVAVHAEMPGAIEIRRGEGGIRAWASSPGEYYNAFDGQYVL